MLDIVSRAASYQQPAINKRNDLITITSVTILRCNSTLSNEKIWEIYKLDENTGAEEKIIPIESNPTKNYADLVLKANTLEYGLYRLVYSVKMLCIQTLTAQVDTYLRIIPTGLVLSSLRLAQPMYGGSIEITLGLNQTVVFDPILHSFDIDLLADITRLAFKYTCQIVDSNSPQGYPQASNETFYLDDLKSISRQFCFSSTSIFF